MADPTSFEWQIKDDQNLKNRAQMFVAYDGATETVDALIGAWSAYGGLIDPCIDGEIVGGQITIPLIPNVAWKSTPIVGNNANQVMSLNFENDFNSYLTAILLPTYRESILTAARVPNIGTNPLLALITAITAGSGAVFPNSNSLHDLDALRDAFLTTRRVKGQTQRTRVAG